MKRDARSFLYAALCLLFLGSASRAQNPDLKFIADTLVIQAEGIYETDPDLATLTFDVSAQDKDLKQTYDRASQSMQKIIALAEKSGILKEDLYSGVLTVRPWYDGDRKKNAKSYSVTGQISTRA